MDGPLPPVIQLFVLITVLLFNPKPPLPMIWTLRTVSLTAPQRQETPRKIIQLALWSRSLAHSASGMLAMGVLLLLIVF